MAFFSRVGSLIRFSLPNVELPWYSSATTPPPPPPQTSTPSSPSDSEAPTDTACTTVPGYDDDVIPPATSAQNDRFPPEDTASFHVISNTSSQHTQVVKDRGRQLLHYSGNFEGSSKKQKGNDSQTIPEIQSDTGEDNLIALQASVTDPSDLQDCSVHDEPRTNSDLPTNIACSTNDDVRVVPLRHKKQVTAENLKGKIWIGEKVGRLLAALRSVEQLAWRIPEMM
ncbi:Hypothetical predicted protein [Octopus vulgaris]|uniref:Uncharacterized protein n=1 Tax=Octopus vulgaris TaxID=6645 RepID=A0AA36B420_OCTVU|nr:Hypothetical predicted protein [Octopus vulgaris]